MPVPRILAEGSDFIAVEDAGLSLTRFCGDRSRELVSKQTACRAAGRALARLHASGLAHGRPAFRDMCWDGQQIRFIDFEYFKPTKAGRLRKAPRSEHRCTLGFVSRSARPALCVQPAIWLLGGSGQMGRPPYRSSASNSDWAVRTGLLLLGLSKGKTRQTLAGFSVSLNCDQSAVKSGGLLPGIRG